MTSLGVHFALSLEDAERLLAADPGAPLQELVVEDFEERYLEEGEWAFQSDKAWDGIHRCLSGGTLLYGTGPHPDTYAVLGGVALDAGEDYTVCVIEPAQALACAARLAQIDEAELRRRHDALEGTDDYDGPFDDAGFQYIWTNLVDLQAFLRRAGEAGRDVIFTVDQ